MLLDLRPDIFHRQNDNTGVCRLGIRFLPYILLFIFFLSALPVQANAKKSYLQLERSLAAENSDLRVTSIGGLLFDADSGGHIDLTYLESVTNGDGLTLDMGGSYVFRWNVSFFVGLGVALGYNWDNDDYIASYYPEAGAVYEITKKFGVTVSGKRYFNLYDKPENIIKLGLLFSY